MNTINTVEVYDVQGRLIEQSNYQQESIEIDFISQEQGIYFLKLYSQKGISIHKIIKI